MAAEIYVINVGGYIGSSTRSEIEYAKATVVMVPTGNEIKPAIVTGVKAYKKKDVPILSEKMKEVVGKIHRAN